MPKTAPLTSKILDRLESFYGKQEPIWPTDPYLFLVWWYCGYPASDAACSKGWESLNREIGVEPVQLVEEPTSWRDFARTWLNEHQLPASVAVLVAGPSTRNPGANYRLEFLVVGELPNDRIGSLEARSASLFTETGAVVR